MVIQTTLMPRGFVLMQQAFSRHAVNNWYSRTIGGRGGLFVGLLNRLDNLFDVGAQLRAMTTITLAMVFGLAGPFSCLE